MAMTKGFSTGGGIPKLVAQSDAQCKVHQLLRGLKTIPQALLSQEEDTRPEKGSELSKVTPNLQLLEDGIINKLKSIRKSMA